MNSLKLKPVPKTYSPKRACVYVISHPSILAKQSILMEWLTASEPVSIYIGVTGGEISQRWRDHKALRARDNQTTSRFIRDNGLEFEECFRILFEGTIDQCYNLEYHLRPRPGMGLNTKIGGFLKHRKIRKQYTDMIEEASLCSS